MSKLGAKDVTVIGTYHPPQRKAYLVANHIIELTQFLGLKPFVEPRAKHHRKAAWFREDLHAECRLTAQTKEDEGWHQDLDNAPGARMDCGLVLWAESMPTQFRYEDGTIFQPEPGEIVLANNLTVYHRRPPGVPVQRMSFRQRVEWPK